jgi:hypothetical protein
MVKELPH